MYVFAFDGASLLFEGDASVLLDVAPSHAYRHVSDLIASWEEAVEDDGAEKDSAAPLHHAMQVEAQSTSLPWWPCASVFVWPRDGPVAGAGPFAWLAWQCDDGGDGDRPVRAVWAFGDEAEMLSCQPERGVDGELRRSWFARAARHAGATGGGGRVLRLRGALGGSLCLAACGGVWPRLLAAYPGEAWREQLAAAVARKV